MGSHYYTPVKGESKWLVKCQPCGDVREVADSEILALAAATRINREIEESFNPEGRKVNPASFGLSRRMRQAKHSRQ